MAVPKRILFLNNQPRVTQLVRQAFEETGEYLIKEESNREMAAEAVQRFQPDLILFDLSGDEVNGREALEELRSDWGLGNTPLIALKSMNGETSIGYSSSIDGYECSVGPISMEELAHCVDEMLQ
jgi:CheY-like chemotaxis protein